VAHDESQEGWVLNQDREQLKLANKFIGLLQKENAQLHSVLRLLGQLVDDMNANCSFEVFEHQWEGLTDEVNRLSGFFETHQKALQSLQDSIPAVWDQDEVDDLES
jgi:hypothetical protein